MDSTTLRKVQLVQLEILKEFKRVCDILEINYWLDSGTFLGAVRHGGFIPWDDDVDVGMLRKDYERFVKSAPGILYEKYNLQTWDNNPGYYFCFAKLRKDGTIYRELKSSPNENNGIYIDIFPYDVYPKNKLAQQIQHYRVDVLKRMITINGGYRPWKTTQGTDWKRFFQYMPIRFLSMFSSKAAKEKYVRYATLYNGTSDYEYYFPSGVSQYGRWLINREFLENLETIKFEDTEFKCPSSYHQYLTSAYGDYMKLPPVEKRNIGHSIIEVYFGDEN